MSVESICIEGIDMLVLCIGFGIWVIGGWMWGGVDDVMLVEIIWCVVEFGINLIDIVLVYGFGYFEEVVGKVLQGLCDKVVIVIKVVLEWSDVGIYCNVFVVCICWEVEDLLWWLKIDCIDLYQIYWLDLLVVYEEIVGELECLCCDGKIFVIGVSNYLLEQMDGFCQFVLLVSVQLFYNLFECVIDVDVLFYVECNGIVVLVYGVLCCGLFFGWMNVEICFDGDDLCKFDLKFQQFCFVQYLVVVV